MTKLVYPETSVYEECSVNFEKCIAKLNRANSVSYSIPCSFNGSGYLASLKGLLSKHINEMKSISNKASRTSNKTKQLINDLTVEARSIENINIKDREKIIL